MLPGTLDNRCNHYLVALVEIRKGAFGGKVHLIECREVTIEVCGIVNRFAVGVISKKAKVTAEAFSHFEDAAVIYGICHRLILIVLENGARCICEALARISRAHGSAPILESKSVGRKPIRARNSAHDWSAG